MSIMGNSFSNFVHVMNLLAIDPATKSGWATAEAYGCWDISIRPNESDGIKWLRFKARLEEVCQLANISIIVYERPAGRHTNAVIHHAKLVAIIETFCAEHNIEFKGYSSTRIKKHATGKGNCSKAAMVLAAHELLGYDGEDDNEADALWLYSLAAEDLGL